MGLMAQLCFSFVTLSTLSLFLVTLHYGHLVSRSGKCLANPKKNTFYAFPESTRTWSPSQIVSGISSWCLDRFYEQLSSLISSMCWFRRKDFFVWETEKLFSFAQLYHALACKHLAGMPQYKLNIGKEMFSARLNSVVPKLGGATPGGGRSYDKGGAARLRDSVQSADYFTKETSEGW